MTPPVRRLLTEGQRKGKAPESGACQLLTEWGLAPGSDLVAAFHPFLPLAQ